MSPAACCVVLLLAALTGWGFQEVALPANQWVELCRDADGARRGSALRYAPNAGAFFLWGFMNSDPDLLQEHPLMPVPEYDMVFFDPAVRRWQNHFPQEWEKLWTRKLPLAYTPRAYSGITTGSERTVLRGPAAEKEGVARPDLNVVFDQVTYVPGRKWLVYFTGGLTAAYDVAARKWIDLSPRHAPPPVLGGSLSYDPFDDAIVLFGGGHVLEPGPGREPVGYTSTWVYRFADGDWHRVSGPQPPPRMNTRLVLDSKNRVHVLFGGDAQSHYLADTWLFDLKTRQWRASRATSGPAARAGHFTVHDPETGWVVVGGGYNRSDLDDMWAYDAATDRWHTLTGKVPVGFYLTADLAPEKRMIVLATSTRAAGDTMTCNILYPVRTTYGYRIDRDTITGTALPAQAGPISKRTSAENVQREDQALRRKVQAERLAGLPVNHWVALEDPDRIAPTRTWGSATFDSDRGLILYWGGGHCGYEGNDVDLYDVAAHSWRSSDTAPEYPERLWNHGARLAGVTFRGRPWTEHGRRIYAYDPISRHMAMVRTIRLTEGYEPEVLRGVAAVRHVARDALVRPPSSYLKYATWTFDPDSGKWQLIGGAPAGLDTLLTTPHGVMGLGVQWPRRLNDAGYMLPWDPRRPEDSGLYLLDVASRRWRRQDQSQVAPQNLYEQTSLVYDSRRNRVLLHGAGARRDELWAFAMKTRRWEKLDPKVEGPTGLRPPVCTREAVYLPDSDVFLLYGPAEEGADPAVWTYDCRKNTWRKVDIAGSAALVRTHAGQNRAMVYDPARGLILLVLGGHGDDGQASVFALRYR